MHQAKRKGLIVSYDPIPDADLKALYEKTNCSYCGKETKREDRTIDHVVPLAKGGPHAIANLAMACFSCNSSKQDKDLQEWVSQRE
jgi:5-methylcytosine-specific restriction endonuclease McrA